jgi:hypothetical protein
MKRILLQSFLEIENESELRLIPKINDREPFASTLFLRKLLFLDLLPTGSW